MTYLHQFIYFVLWMEIIGAALFLSACAIGFSLLGCAMWSGRRKR